MTHSEILKVQKAKGHLVALKPLNFTSVRTEANLDKKHVESYMLYFFLYTFPDLVC